jgi:hypothetical protein
MCHLNNCKNPGTCSPVLELRPRKNKSGPKLRFKDVSVCDEHRETSTIDTFLSDEGYTKISKQLREAGKTPPARKNITLSWESAGPELLGARVPLVDGSTACDDEELTF